MPRFLLVLIILLTLMASAKGEVLDIHASGSGKTTLVLIAGLASSHSVWEAQRAHYADNYRVLTVQLAGFAGVAPTATALENPVAEAVEVLSAHLAELGGPVILVGHSLGGQLTLQVARKLPEQIQKVLVVDSLPFLAQMYWPGITPAEAISRAQIMGQFMLQQNEADFRQQQRASLAILSKQPDFLPTLTAWADGSDKATVIHAMQELLASDYRSTLAEVNADVTAMLAWDAAMPLEKEALQSLYYWQYNQLPTVNFVTIENSFHFVMQDQPGAFNQALAEFLEDK